MLRLSLPTALLLHLGFLVAACGDDDGTPDAAMDAAADMAVDTAEDTASDAGADADADPPDMPLEEILCSTEGDFDELGACAQTANIATELDAIVGARPLGTAAHLATRARLAERLDELGFEVELQDYGAGVNVVGTRVGTASPDELVVISAHYDTIPGCPGADDNGSGVAGALEAARVLAMVDHDRTLVIAFWDEEELGKLGAHAWANRAREDGARVVVSFVFEMIGYKDDEPDTQSLPPGFGILFGAAANQVTENDNRGDFIALVAGDDASDYTDALVASGSRLGHKAFAIELNEGNRRSALTGDLRRSDHDAFWSQGWPSMMITDTANFRNPNYHCDAGPDAVADLDLEFARNNVAITIAAAALALSDEAPTGGVAAVEYECDLSAGTGCAEGEHCTLHNDAGWAQPRCVELQAETVGDGEVCMRPDGALGEDDCDATLVCTFWGVPRDEGRICSPLCESSTDCDGDAFCQGIGTPSTRGACLPRCDPFDDTCAEGLSCQTGRRSAEGTQEFGCHRLGANAAGAECLQEFDDCAPGLGCAPDPSDGVGRCGELCDDTHPCPDGKSCVASPNPAASRADSGIGVCF